MPVTDGSTSRRYAPLGEGVGFAFGGLRGVSLSRGLKLTLTVIRVVCISLSRPDS